MNLSDFVIGFSLVYVTMANFKQYMMVREWSDSHSGCDISYYEDWLQSSKTLCKLNRVNTFVGSLGRRFAYRQHLKNG